MKDKDTESILVISNQLSEYIKVTKNADWTLSSEV